MIVALVAAVVLGVARLGSGLIDQSDGGRAPAPDCESAIAWEDARGFEGEQATVRGPVVGVAFVEAVSGQPTFLNVGADHPDPDRFTVVIWNDVRRSFDTPPDIQFSGVEICVAGEIRIHDGSPQIELEGPASIQVAD